MPKWRTRRNCEHLDVDGERTATQIKRARASSRTWTPVSGSVFDPYHSTTRPHTGANEAADPTVAREEATGLPVRQGLVTVALDDADYIRIERDAPR